MILNAKGQILDPSLYFPLQEKEKKYYLLLIDQRIWFELIVILHQNAVRKFQHIPFCLNNSHHIFGKEIFAVQKGKKFSYLQELQRMKTPSHSWK